MSYSNETFAHRLKVARVDAKMKQSDFAEASGVDVNSIARYEMGTVTPGLDKAYALAVALGTDLDTLVEFGKAS
ncbi:MAG: helix-turn-helix transcriptional regulator [Eggerthellaceae bacterium]|nr:helix-turn-helix transcriptional regulator [Eggerthellaceae bacterium]